MSWWISLQENGEFCDVPLFEEGGTYALGGSCEADLNVTYNYGGLFNFRGLDGRTGAETQAELDDAVARLGTERDMNYWAATPGNAGVACALLASWARLYPDAVWHVS